LNTAAEGQLCPTSALSRNFIEEPYFEYRIDKDLCIGCAKCVKGCTSFGNGSLHLQIMQDLCVNCNQCAIARMCPSDAIQRVKGNEPYKIKGSFTKESSGSEKLTQK
jgi:electron transport complex protein RnfB